MGGRGSSLVTHASYESRRREIDIGDGLSRERTRERGARDRRERGGRILRRLRLCVLTTRSRSHQRQRACATRAGRLFFTPKRLLDGLSRHNIGNIASRVKLQSPNRVSARRSLESRLLTRDSRVTAHASPHARRARGRARYNLFACAVAHIICLRLRINHNAFLSYSRA